MSINREWRPVDGFEGLYMVSDRGDIMSMKTGRGAQKGKILSQCYTGAGYKKVTLRRDHKSYQVMTHRAVAMAFIPNPDKKGYVNHIDGDKANNVVSNLEWVTASENCLHSIRALGNRHGGVEHSVKLTKQQAVEIIKSDLPNIELAHLYGVSDSMISRIKKRKAWRSVACL